MTRDEFDAFMDGEQWTPEQVARFARHTPVGSPAVVRNERARPDGWVEVVPHPRPGRSVFWRWVCLPFVSMAMVGCVSAVVILLRA